MAETPDTPPETPPSKPPEPSPGRTQARRGVYFYDGTANTFHPVLGLIHVGENRWPDPSPEQQAALDAMTKKGILRQG